MTKPSELYGRPWSEREYIIVLHYYRANRSNPRHHLANYIKEVAALLGRTPSAVVMRMENYASLDPEEASRTGLINISNLGKKVFEEWQGSEDSLKACAEVLIRDIQNATVPTLFDPEPVRIPRAFGKYELLDPLGDGGFGSVYSCVNTQDQAAYALKIIKTDRLLDREVVSRFRREIRMLKTIRHPNVIQIHEDNLDDTPNFPAFVMDLAKCSLTQYLENTLGGRPSNNGLRPTLDPTRAAVIIQEVIKGVEVLHSNAPPVAHRDIKPDNVLLMPNDTWVIADFSLAKFLPQALVTTTFATASRQAWGTHGYSAPEQFQDFRLADQRADIYGLGVLTWELFSPSWPPYDRGATGLADPLEKVVLRATERIRENRYQSIFEFRSAVTEALAEMSLCERSESS
jgi:serine/threonine protein kinase